MKEIKAIIRQHQLDAVLDGVVGMMQAVAQTGQRSGIISQPTERAAPGRAPMRAQ